MDKSYRVHDMVVDLVCFLPSEENFVTQLHDTEQNSGQIQRQEIQDYPSKRAYGRYDYQQQHASNVVSRSSRVIADPVVMSSVQVLPVLDLEYCAACFHLPIEKLGTPELSESVYMIPVE